MIKPGQALRLFNINLVLLGHGLDEIILATRLFRPIRFIRYLTPWYWLRGPLEPRGIRIRRMLEELGPIFVKFGQILSTRRDLLPVDIITELSKLQDNVPPFPTDQARAIIEKALDAPPEQVFQEFNETPLASASIAQVYAARLKDGRSVIVKVVRPGIDKVIRRDVGLLYIFAELAQRYWSEGRRLRPREVVAEFEKTILDELDLMREAANAAQLRRNFLESELLYVPEVDWPHTRENVIVMERISGIRISNIEALKQHGTDFKELSERGVEIFFTQVFRDNFFHADMHPGNIFVDPKDPKKPRYIVVDFGIMGSLSPSDQRYLAENLLAFFNRDYLRVAELHVESGWVPSGTRVDEFQSAIRTVCEPIFDRPLKDISFGHFLLRLFQTARRFNMEVQPQLGLLQKTLLNVESLGRELYPDLDLWQTAKPFLERWMNEQVGTRSVLRRLRSQLPRWTEEFPEFPALLHDVLKQATQGRIRLHAQEAEMEKLRTEIRRANRRNLSATTGASLILSAFVLLGLEGLAPPMLAGAPVLSWVLGALGVVFVLAAWPKEPG
jgi:2-polyprenylphenol 6-hydroxylase